MRVFQTMDTAFVGILYKLNDPPAEEAFTLRARKVRNHARGDIDVNDEQQVAPYTRRFLCNVGTHNRITNSERELGAVIRRVGIVYSPSGVVRDLAPQRTEGKGRLLGLRPRPGRVRAFAGLAGRRTVERTNGVT